MPRPRDEEKRNSCLNCFFWEHTGQDDTGAEVGLCRINPPMQQSEFTNSQWPITLGADWCGAYRRGAFPQGIQAQKPRE